MRSKCDVSPSEVLERMERMLLEGRNRVTLGSERTTNELTDDGLDAEC